MIFYFKKNFKIFDFFIMMRYNNFDLAHKFGKEKLEEKCKNEF